MLLKVKKKVTKIRRYDDHEFWVLLILYSVSANFCLELIGPSARGVFTLWTLVEREEWVGES